MAVKITDQKDVHTNTKQIKKYIAEQDETIRPRLEDVYKVISDAMPNAEERISAAMLISASSSDSEPVCIHRSFS